MALPQSIGYSPLKTGAMTTIFEPEPSEIGNPMRLV